MKRVLTGLDRLREAYWKELKGYGIGLLANQASLDSRLDTAPDVVSQVLPGQLKAIFGPQHGFGGEDQDNMKETAHSIHRDFQIPIYSLYADTREPQPHMLDGIDLLMVDLQDVGTRVYTFPSTLLNCMRAAAQLGKRVLVLDRPNPLGGEIVEGSLLQPELYSFVGPYRFPMRHGLTLGEMARMFDHVFDLSCDLEILPMAGWKRQMLWDDTGLRWAMPSPNMPFMETARVYPGQVIWEGTNVSEGRGTCRPFEIFGAPYLDTHAIRRVLDPHSTAGCHLQDYVFRPTFHKWEGRLCYGFMIHILDPHIFRPFSMSMALLQAMIRTHERSFEWKPPPYEYEYKKTPIDLIVGDPSLRQDLESGLPLADMERKWAADLKHYLQWRRPYLLYS